MINVTATNVVPVLTDVRCRPSCPNADNNFDGCETNFKHDLHNASLQDFSNIIEMTSSHWSVRENYIFRAVQN